MRVIKTYVDGEGFSITLHSCFRRLANWLVGDGQTKAVNKPALVPPGRKSMLTALVSVLIVAAFALVTKKI